MLYTIAEAAKATGLEESIIFRAIEDGQIHGTRNVSGEWHVEDAELHSLYLSIAQHYCKHQWQTDLQRVWLGMKHCIPVTRRFGGGAIANTSSVYGLIASGKATAYHAAKGGVLMVSRAAAVEYAQDGIQRPRQGIALLSRETVAL
jgi:NAD(P)-dependent dehydrogenase (short-subunit alcohol dehydrogenase family)